MARSNPASPERKCRACGRVVRLNDNYCPTCGVLLPGGKPYLGQGQPGETRAVHIDNPQCVDQVELCPVDSHSRVVAGLMAIFLGWMGLHNFYLGYYLRAVCQLLLGIVIGPLTFGLGSLAVAIWTFIEGILIIAAAPGYRADARGVCLRD